MAYYDRLRAEIPPSLVELLRIPGSGPRPSASSTPSSASRPSTTCARPPRTAVSEACAGCPTKTEALVLEGIARLDDRFDRMRLDQAEEILDGA